MKSLVNIVVLAMAGLVLAGCPEGGTPPPGGLELEDFEQVAEMGFDPVDQEQDHNDYAWSMSYYQADGAAQGYLYIGTWNRVQQWKGFHDKQSVYPEIRRYRPDISPTTWETVLDTRTLNLTDAERPHGFREMKAYRNKSDGKQYLYAGGRGDTTTLWRSETGEPGTWECFYTLNREGSIRGLAVHNGLLYMSFYNDYGLFEFTGEPRAVILATDGAEVWTVSDDGFGNPFNIGIFTIASFNGWLYAGVHNQAQGAEVWKLEGPDPDVPPVKILGGGGPEPINEAGLTMYVYNDHLYVGMVANHFARMLNGLKAAALVRVAKDDSWETIAGPGSLSGIGSGFGGKGNSYIWSMCEHNGWLYVGTYDIITGLTYMLTHPEYMLSMMGGSSDDKQLDQKGFDQTIRDLLVSQPQSGADLYKSPDGVHWYPITLDGFGNHNTYGFRNMASVDGRLFIGTANPYDGLTVFASRPPAELP